MLSLKFSQLSQLETERLLLKKITNDDAPALFEMRSDREVMRHIDRPLAKTIDDALALIQVLTDGLDANNAVTWGIFLKEQPARLVGTLGFWQIQKEHYRAEIGYLLHPSLQGKGIMREAIIKAMEYAFSVMKLHSVEANVNAENLASRKLLEKLDFVQEAYFKENYYSNGRFIDSVVYSILTPFQDAVPAPDNSVQPGN